MMNVFDQARLVIYRINQKGLEIFLVSAGEENWEIPNGALSAEDAERIIKLEPIQTEDGEKLQAIAVEGDWHDIPSIRHMLKQDVKIVTHQLKQWVPDLDKGAFFAVKEAFKKVMPEEYGMIKELKEILFDRNQTKYI